MNTEDCIKEIPGRLKEIEDFFDLNKREMSERISLSRSYYSTVATGQQSPSFDFLLRVCIEFNISADWMIFGTGRMFRADNEFISDMDPLWIDILKNVYKFSHKQRTKFFEHMIHVLKLMEDEEEHK